LDVPSPYKIIIFTAPSGSGKTTIVRHLLESNKSLAFSISACNRPPRAGEVDMRDYYFLSTEEFKEKIKNTEFVEWEEVYDNRFYGTLRSEIERLWGDHKHILFDVDVQGALQLKSFFKNQALAIFVKVPSLETLQNRLNERGTEDEKSLKKRLEKAQAELAFEDKFDKILLNEDLEKTLKTAQKWVDDFLKA
jgi:guanylate kinase